MIATIRIARALVVIGGMTVLFAPLQLIAVKTGWWRGRRLLRTWHRVAARMIGLRVRVVGGPAAGRPLMLASNHVSWLDIVTLGSVADVSFIAKSEVAGWPVFGWFSKMQRSVHIEREKRGRSGEQAVEIARRLAAGDIMLLFAEGTTGDGNLLLPFKTTLFGAASMLLSASEHDRLWIQPVAVAYTRVHGLPMGRRHRPLVSWIGDQDMAPHLLGVLRESALDVEVHFGEPVAFDAGSNRKLVAREIEDRVRRMVLGALADPAASR
jgi:1-acyl-sn-glycerol-3-phosphate acyltransferase